MSLVKGLRHLCISHMLMNCLSITRSLVTENNKLDTKIYIELSNSSTIMIGKGSIHGELGLTMKIPKVK